MRSGISIDIAATPARVIGLASDISRWPDLLPHYRQVTVTSHVGERIVAGMHAVRRFGWLAVPVSWRTEQWSDASDPDDLRLLFRHVGGITKGMVVTWHIRRTEAGAHVTIEHEFARHLPFLGDDFLPRVIDRFFVRPIASRTLATFKRLAESAR